MVKYASAATDLVQKREQLMKEGYKLPGADVDNFTQKLAGVTRRKNLWKNFKRLIIRRRAVLIKTMKDKFTYNKRGRKLTKEEKAMVLKESEALVDAADQGNKKLVKTALKFYADVDHVRAGRTSFQMVFVRVCLIDAGLEVEPSWQEGFKGSNRADYEGVMRHLLDNGADINALEGSNTDGYAVVHHAARLGCYDRVKYFLENGGTVDLRTQAGETALMFACLGGHLDVIMLLIFSKHDIQARNHNGNTMLHFAAMTGNLHVINFLLECGANKNAVDEEGRTPLDICKERSFKVCLERLQKFKMPKASNGDLIEFWRSMQEDLRPDSRSLFSSLMTPSSTARSSSSRYSNRTRFVKKDKFRGTSFHQRGGKDVNRADRAARKKKEKAQREHEEYLRDNPPIENPLMHLESLVRAAPKPPSPSKFIQRSAPPKKKKRSAKKDENYGSGDGEVLAEGQEEVESLLKEIEEEAGDSNAVSGKIEVNLVSSPKNVASSEAKTSFLSPLSFFGDGAKLELFGKKIAETLSPFRKRSDENKKVALDEPGDQREATDTTLPVILVSPTQAKVDVAFNFNVKEQEEQEESPQRAEHPLGDPVKRKKKGKKKKKKKKSRGREEGSDVEALSGELEL